jgi:predicted DsbA family dithiol-disulfide isomerase
MNNTGLEIISYTDPYCTWCWGSEPILRKIQEVYGQQVRIRFVMGGLVEDMRKFSDPGAGIGGELWYKQVAEHWLEASNRHKMPVDEQVYYDIKDEVFSTHPACIAFEAAQLQDEEIGVRYLRRLREGAAAERKAIQHFEVQVQLAEEVGLDIEQFTADIQSGKANSIFQEDLQECRMKGVRGFPTFLVRSSEGEVFLRGYTPYQTLESWLQELSKDQLEQKILKGESTQVFDFISRYGKTAIIEVATVFNLDFIEAGKLLTGMAEKGLIFAKKAGNGFLYSLPKQISQECNPDTGVCSI